MSLVIIDNESINLNDHKISALKGGEIQNNICITLPIEIPNETKILTINTAGEMEYLNMNVNDLKSLINRMLIMEDEIRKLKTELKTLQNMNEQYTILN